jgi:hypothetical protein
VRLLLHGKQAHRQMQGCRCCAAIEFNVWADSNQIPLCLTAAAAYLQVLLSAASLALALML